MTTHTPPNTPLPRSGNEASSQPPTPVRVLLIEDNPDDEILITRALRKGGFSPEVRRAQMPEELLEAISIGHWDIVISDYYLPRFSALDALRILQEHQVPTPCIVVSGKIGEENAAAVMRSGAHDYVNKSNLARLAPAVRRELEESGLRQEHETVKEKLHQSEAEVERQRQKEREIRLLSQIVSGVAHEVRNPLNAITALMESFLAEVGDEQKFEPYRHYFAQQVDRLSSLMQDLLELGRPIDHESLKPLDLCRLCKETAEVWSHVHAESPRELVVNCESDLIVQGDSNRLQNTVSNLLENASQHSPANTPLALRAYREGNQGIIEVTDRGSGVKEDHLPRIFDPFFTTRKGGVGLGLGIVRHTIESHDGTVEMVNNEPGPGATVIIRLPLKSKS